MEFFLLHHLTKNVSVSTKFKLRMTVDVTHYDESVEEIWLIAVTLGIFINDWVGCHWQANERVRNMLAVYHAFERTIWDCLTNKNVRCLRAETIQYLYLEGEARRLPGFAWSAHGVAASRES